MEEEPLKVSRQRRIGGKGRLRKLDVQQEVNKLKETETTNTPSDNSGIVLRRAGVHSRGKM
ncbi:hypothetical protein EXN66_Car016438 [Channa argus]|uniref:Uncharacterized protein n=1 Tax=Channa argus TaxID=215402 RepID=A0A6G1QDK3_CHAAH|nr:hypothetical protein EXN66_Car016438 [Channa argus]